MTTRRLRPFLVWLLALVLPWQAAVVAAMAHGVGQEGGGMTAVGAVGHASVASPLASGPHGLRHDDASQAAPGAPCPHSADAAAPAAGDAGADASEADADGAAHHGADPAAKRCGTTASCCAWAACMPPALSAALDAPASPRPAAAPTGPVAFLTDVPLRPPRPLAA